MLRAPALPADAALRIPTPTPTAPTPTLAPSAEATQVPSLSKLLTGTGPSPAQPATDPLKGAAESAADLARQGPGAVLDALGHAVSVLAENTAWILAVVVAAVLARTLAVYLVNRLTARLSGPTPTSSRWRAVVARSTRRSRARHDVNGMPLAGASLTALVERRRQRARAIGSLSKSLVSGALVAFVLLVVVARVGLPGGVLFSAGIIGLVLAVLVQGVARDILGGIWLLFEDAYGVGDYVDAGFGAVGVVEEIGLRTSRLRGPDGTVWRIRHSDLPRLGNRTQQQTLVMLDVSVTFPDDRTKEEREQAPARVIGQSDLARAERLVRGSLDRLDRDLLAARRATFGVTSAGSLPSTVAALVPDLVPEVTRDDLARLDAIGSPALDDTQPMDGLAEMLQDVEVPVLTGTAVAGLSGASADTITLRVRGTVADTSRAQALAVLRRRLFLDVTGDGLAVSFSEVDPADL